LAGVRDDTRKFFRLAAHRCHSKMACNESCRKAGGSFQCVPSGEPAELIAVVRPLFWTKKEATAFSGGFLIDCALP
jgi:hypothetical protein